MSTPKITTEEERFIRENYRTMTSAQIADTLGCNTDRIDYVEKLLGLRKYEPWTEKKSILLRQYCSQNMRTSEMAALLGVAQKSVYNHIRALGLTTEGSRPGRPKKTKT